jgi:hypothetical protein
VRECRSCGSEFDERFRYCPWCGTAQRLKIVEYFPAFRFDPSVETKGLRVSRYLSPPRHVRFSVWSAGEVKAAVSLDDADARRLAAFLDGTDPSSRPGLAGRLRQSADALLETLR